MGGRSRQAFFVAVVGRADSDAALCRALVKEKVLTGVTVTYGPTLAGCCCCCCCSVGLAVPGRLGVDGRFPADARDPDLVRLSTATACTEVEAPSELTLLLLIPAARSKSGNVLSVGEIGRVGGLSLDDDSLGVTLLRTTWNRWIFLPRSGSRSKGEHENESGRKDYQGGGQFASEWYARLASTFSPGKSWPLGPLRLSTTYSNFHISLPLSSAP